MGRGSSFIRSVRAGEDTRQLNPGWRVTLSIQVVLKMCVATIAATEPPTIHTGVLSLICTMRSDFATENCPAESLVVFDHARAHEELGRASSGPVPRCCSASRSNSSWLTGNGSETVAAEVSWRSGHDSERPGVDSHSGADHLLPRPVGAPAQEQPPRGIGAGHERIPGRGRANA